MISNIESNMEYIIKELDSLKKRMEILERLTKGPKKEDEIFLLSEKEYKKYKDVIPEVNTWWWLRSPGSDSNRAAYVSGDGSISYNGDSVNVSVNAVRPAIKVVFLNDTAAIDLMPHRFIKYDFPWIYIGDGLAIAEVPIAFRRFDSKSNDYENSEIRQFLLDWIKARQGCF